MSFYGEKIKCNAVKCCGNCVELLIENDGYIHCGYYGVPVGLFDTCDIHHMYDREMEIEKMIIRAKEGK